jgi:predicted peptidase
MNFVFASALLALCVLIISPFLLGIPHGNVGSGTTQGIMKPGGLRYTLHVPNGYTDDKAVPLILVLHYGGHGAPYYGKYVLEDLAEPALREIGAIIVSPDCPERDWTHPRSEKLVLALLDRVQKKYNINRKRILITGYSMGGIGVWHFAGHFPERFTAGIAMAAAPPDEAIETDWQIPLYVIHGRKDELFPISQTTKIVNQLEEQGVDITYRILENVTHYESFYYVQALMNAIPWLLEKWEK